MDHSCLIVGAGIAGLAAAHRLRAAGWQVDIVDKGRTVGGRMATRTFDEGRFDYGAQFFTTRDEPFAELARPWIASGLAAPWTGHRFRVPSGMRAVTEDLAAGLHVRTATRVTGLERSESGWRAVLESGEMLHAASLLLTPPVPQSLALLDAGGVPLEQTDRALLEQAVYWKCITVLLRIEGSVHIAEPGYVQPEQGDLAWIGDNLAKGVSPLPGCLTLHGTREFSETHWEEPQAVAVNAMLSAAEPYFQGRVRSYYLHRWRYAEPVAQLPVLFHAAGNLVFAGDAFGGGRVGGAASSGLAAADYLKTLTA